MRVDTALGHATEVVDALVDAVAGCKIPAVVWFADYGPVLMSDVSVLLRKMEFLEGGLEGMREGVPDS